MPRTSFSLFRDWDWLQSSTWGRSGICTTLSSPITLPNMSTWFWLRVELVCWEYFKAVSTWAACWARVPSSPSRAPAMIRLSKTLLFNARESTRKQRSNKFSKGPSASRSSTIFSRALVPTFLMAFSPKEMVFLSTGRKLTLDILISGLVTSIPSLRHSLIRITTRSILDISLVRLALMKAAG